MNLQKQDVYFRTYISDLMRKSEYGYPEFSYFLDLSQREICSFVSYPGVKKVFYGGVPDCQRVMMGAFSEDEEPDFDRFPISVVLIEYQTRFLKRPIEHRDILGALLSLKIKRSMIGDILIDNDKGCAAVFVHKDMAEYTVQHLKSVSNVGVSACISAVCPIKPKADFDETVVTVSSLRLDCITAAIINKGRNTACEMIASEAVKVNDRIIKDNSFKVNQKDIITVRGSGKYVFDAARPTKKGRQAVLLLKYR